MDGCGYYARVVLDYVRYEVERAGRELEERLRELAARLAEGVEGGALLREMLSHKRDLEEQAERLARLARRVRDAVEILEKACGGE